MLIIGLDIWDHLAIYCDIKDESQHINLINFIFGSDFSRLIRRQNEFILQFRADSVFCATIGL